MPSSERLTADEFRGLFRVADRWLSLNRAPVNAINVYPVPDGDTGTNMVLTLRASLRAAEDDDAGAVGHMMQSMAHGALLGARGNSGVILSQMLRGLANALDNREVLDGPALRDALAAAARVAFEAVSNPVEGTMLTVMRDAAEAAAATAAPTTLGGVLDAAATEAHASVDRTPTLLPRLAEAGVVDAGGLGVAVILDGLRYGYRGGELPEPMSVPKGTVDLSAVEHEGHGYCTEFVVIGRGLEQSAIHQALESVGGESLLVVGDAEALHIHVHIENPGTAISVGADAGALESVKVENMQAQHDQWAAGHREIPLAELPSLGLVAVAQGAGVAAAFSELGATQVVDGGPTSNPSAGELLEAARRAGRDHVFLLPNDPNVILAAEQAAAQEPELITVIATRSIAAGLGAVIAYISEGDREDVAAAMLHAAEAVRCVEVTRSVRDATADGITVASGDAIVIVDGTLVASAETLEAAALDGLGRVVDGAEIVTVYLGAGAAADAADVIERLIGDAHPGLEVEVVEGGQTHYPYILGVE